MMSAQTPRTDSPRGDYMECEICGKEIKKTNVQKSGLTVVEYAREPHVVLHRVGHSGYSTGPLRYRHASCDARAMGEGADRAAGKTRTVGRCGFCGYPLRRAFDVPVRSKNMYSNYTIACDWCTKTINSALGDSPFGIRECACGHDLSEHDDPGDEDDLPMPCDECDCKDWREKKKEGGQ